MVPIYNNKKSSDNMWSEELQLKILKDVNVKFSQRIIAFDFETKVLQETDFLSNETILGINVARRLSSDELEKTSFILEEETLASQFKLLKQFSDLLLIWKPLVIVGYGIRFYDQPLLAIKNQLCLSHNQNAYGIKNVVNGAIFIELADLSTYVLLKNYNEKRKYMKMTEIMQHKHFSNLPFIKTKEFYSNSFNDKGKRIYEDWKNKDRKFLDYLDGEAYNQLLIAERIIETELKVK